MKIMKINIEHVYKKYESDLSTIIKKVDGKNNLNLLLQSVGQLEEGPNMNHYQELQRTEYREQFLALISIIDKFNTQDECIIEIQKYAPEYQSFEEVLTTLRKFIHFISEQKLIEIRQHYPDIMEAIENE